VFSIDTTTSPLNFDIPSSAYAQPSVSRAENYARKT